VALHDRQPAGRHRLSALAAPPALLRPLRPLPVPSPGWR
jgi:hypothetical protein